MSSFLDSVHVSLTYAHADAATIGALVVGAAAGLVVVVLALSMIRKL